MVEEEQRIDLLDLVVRQRALRAEIAEIIGRRAVLFSHRSAGHGGITA